MPFALSKDYLDLVYSELEKMPGNSPQLSDFERIAYARRMACIYTLDNFNETMLSLIDRGGFRPSPSDFGDLVRKACGITEIDELPPAQREIYRTDRSRAAEEARVVAETRADRLITGTAATAEGLPALLPGETCRDRARRVIKTLAATSKGGPLASSLTALTKAVDAAGVYDNFTEGDTDEWAP